MPRGVIIIRTPGHPGPLTAESPLTRAQRTTTHKKRMFQCPPVDERLGCLESACASLCALARTNSAWSVRVARVFG